MYIMRQTLLFQRDSCTFGHRGRRALFTFLSKGEKGFHWQLQKEKRCIEARILGDRREKGKQGLVLGDKATLFL